MKFKKEDLTVLVVMILIIIALIYFIPRFTGGVIVPTCMDTDGGEVYNVKGITQIGSSAISGTDYCANEITLKEFSCVKDATGVHLGVAYYDCPTRCIDGACEQSVSASAAQSTLGAEKPFISTSNVWFWVVLALIVIVLAIIIKKLKK